MFHFALALSLAQAPFRMRDYRDLVTVSSVQISPDGTKIALVRSVPNFSTDTRETTLVIVDRATGALQSLTDGKTAVASPRWSPAGDSIAYISSGTEHQDEVFVLSVADSSTKQITHAAAGVQQFSWSPKGDRIAYVTPDNLPVSDNAFELRNVGYRTDSPPVSSHLWLVAADGSNAKRLTHGHWSVLETGAPFAGAPSDPSWSHDGQSIVFSKQANPDNSDSDLSTICRVDTSTGRVRGLSGATTYEYQALYSPVTGSVAFIRPHGPTPLSVMDVFTTDGHGSAKNQTPTLDRDIVNMAWSADGKSLICLGNDGLVAKIWRQPLAGKPMPYPLGELSPTEFSVAKGGSLAFVASTGSSPMELYWYDAGKKSTRRLTDFNAKLRGRAYAKETEFTWTAPDGERSDGVLTTPRTARAGKKLPLVVWIHGGPEAAAIRQFSGFEGDYLRQTLAAEGYMVFEPNYRGSENLGNRHEHAIYRNPALGPASDILSGIAALEAKGMVDPRHITVAGHSYGGYMTSWLITQDHRWKSAVVADGVVDWTQEYCLSSTGNLAWTRDSLGGGPWEPKSAELYRRFSPMNSVNAVRTPTLVITGTADEQVPASESYMLYHALKDRHVPVKFVGIPLAHHTPDSPVKYEQFYQAMERWIVEHDPIGR